MTHRLTIALLLVVALAAPASADTRIEGQTFAARSTVSATELQLNGVGLRAVSWLKAYAAGLYLPKKTRESREALSMPGPKRVQLRMLLEAPAQEFVKALERGVARNTSEAELAALKERLGQLTRAVAAVGKVKKGDVIDLDFQPGQGLLFSHNGRALTPYLPGEDLYPAVLKIFIGEQPIDPELKTGLLGGPAA
jgi:hypothetical protein